MSLENQDWLSAASDNQPLNKAQLDSLLNDAQLQHQLERYHLIGAVLRREPQSPITADFADNFAAQLADEGAGGTGLGDAGRYKAAYARDI